MKRVLIADDHPIMLSGIEAILRESRYEVVAKVMDGEAVLDALPTSRPDILVMDVQMPKRSGMDVVRTLRNRNDMRPIVLLTANLDDDSIIEAIRLQVTGMLLKDGAQALLLQCLDKVAAGGRWIDKTLLERALARSMNQEQQSGGLTGLTARERAVVGLIARGLRNRDIAVELGLTEGTVKVYLHRIYAKLRVNSRTELAIYAKNDAGS